MTRGPEAKIQDEVTRYARTRGCIAYKFESTGRRGVPDYLFSHINCGPFWIEFKAPGAKPRPEQTLRQQEMADAGCTVYACVSNARVGKEIIDDLIARVQPRHLPVAGL